MTRHAETRLLPYTAAQMYDLVADVGRYPEFLPWTAAARVRRSRSCWTRRSMPRGSSGRRW